MQRTRYLRTSIYSVCLSFVAAASFAQSHKVDTMVELNSAYSAIKGMRTIAYTYASDISFPNGNTDHVGGNLYVNYNEKYLYNDCNAYTMIYTRHVFYKADHRKHEIVFTDMDRNYDKRLKRKTEQDIFENGFFEKYSDTSILRKAAIKEMKINADNKLSVLLAFPVTSSIKTIRLLYDKANKIPLLYEVELFQPMQGGKGKPNGVTVKIKCTGFSNGDALALERYKDFFLFSKGKLELKKYTNYKLSSTNKTI